MTDPAHHLGLVLIDFQDGFLNVIPNRENLLKRTCFAIEAAILLNCSTVVTEHVPEKLGHTTKVTSFNLDLGDNQEINLCISLEPLV